MKTPLRIAPRRVAALTTAHSTNGVEMRERQGGVMANGSLCECRRPRGAAAVVTLVIEGNGHTYACEENPRNMPLWRVECVGCGLPFATPIPADWPEGEYVCEACDG